MVNPRARKQSKFKPILKKHILPISIAFLVTLIGLFGSDMTLWLRFDRNAILSGEIWRIFTGHFAHLSWTHLLLNLLGLVLIWGLFDRHLPTKRWLHTIIFNAFGISLLLLIVDSQLLWYVGLSGVLHGMFMVGCMYDLRSGRWDSKLLLLAFIGKILWEQIQQVISDTPSMVNELIGGVVAIDAHLFGAIMGLVTYFVFRRVDGRTVLTAQHS
jgi:rhomboid family GlyGly-CTERM serine protease